MSLSSVIAMSACEDGATERKNRKWRALRIDKDRLWSSLMDHAQIGARLDGGVNREALTPEDGQGRDQFAAWCRDLDMDITVDALGNMFAIYPGTDESLLPIAIGSHLDTQPCGGKFDGILGVIAGLEIVRTLHDAGLRARRPICIVNWTSEEGSRFVPSMAASGVYSGVFSMEEALTWKDRDGIGFVEALKSIGYEGDEPVGHYKFAAFLELHIEQGPVLEKQEKLVGIVTGAQAMSYNTVSIRGRESHAGTTPMDMRLDPVAAFNRIAAACYDKANATPDARFTVGLIETVPASHSTIPQQVNFTLDLRHPEEVVLTELKATYEEAADRERDLGFEIERDEFGASPELAFDETCVSAIRHGAETCGYSALELVSGAGHDAVYVARVCPTAMIFTPCKDGISHNPAESISLEQAEAGTNVLLQAAINLANA